MHSGVIRHFRMIRLQSKYDRRTCMVKIVKFDPNLPTLESGPMRQKKSAQRESRSRFRFRSVDGREIGPHEWLLTWGALYPHKYNLEHDQLLQECERVSGEYIERIGRWKDSANTHRKWRPNVASVAYEIWMKAASELPSCPEEGRVVDF